MKMSLSACFYHAPLMEVVWLAWLGYEDFTVHRGVCGAKVVRTRAYCNVRMHSRRHSARDPVHAVLDDLRLLRCQRLDACMQKTNCTRDQCDAERVNIAQASERNNASASVATAHSTVSSPTPTNARGGDTGVEAHAT